MMGNSEIGIPNEMRNTLYNMNVFDVLDSLPDKSINTVFGDPDYNVGIKYNKNSYRMEWEKYIEWYCELAIESMRVLAEDGNLFFVNYPKQNAWLRANCLDDLAYRVEDYAWVYNTNVGMSKSRFTPAHRSILHATKSPKNKFLKNAVAEPYQNPNDKRVRYQQEKGSKGRMPYSWMMIQQVKNVSKEKRNHPCQIPQELTQKLFNATLERGDSVAILFAGSGNEIRVAESMGVDWVSAELDTDYCQSIWNGD